MPKAYRTITEVFILTKEELLATLQNKFPDVFCNVPPDSLTIEIKIKKEKETSIQSQWLELTFSITQLRDI